MKRYSFFTSGALLMALALASFSCSSSKHTESEGDEAPVVDAGTDAVPEASAEANIQPEDIDIASEEADVPEQQPTSSLTDPEAEKMLAPVEAQVDAPIEAPVVANAEEPAAPEPAAPIAAQIPSEEPVQAPQADSADSKETYTVHRGDTLMRIAFEHYGDLYKWKAIYEANRDQIKDPNLILPGTVLHLENANRKIASRTGEKYLVKQGDTLGTISSEVYGTPRKWKEIWQHNRSWIPNPNKIFAGFYVYYTASPEDKLQDETHVAPPQMALDDVFGPAQAEPQGAEAPRSPASGEEQAQ